MTPSSGRKREQRPTSTTAQDNEGTPESSNKRKKSAATRIGRACDRCQHRKLACDPAPEGCPHCRRNHAWCTATDPLTGTPTYRGEFEYLERTVARQRDKIQDLVDKLRSLGEDVSGFADDDPGTAQYLLWRQIKATGDTRPWDREENNSRTTVAQHNPSSHGDMPQPQVQEANMRAPSSSLPVQTSTDQGLSLPDLRTGIAVAGDDYLGVSANNPFINSHHGSKLNMLGWQFDMESLVPADSDRSYQGFITSIFGVNPTPDPMPLPPREDAFIFASTYFHVLNRFLPILHKSTVMALLERVYDSKAFKPTPAEDVIVHMLFACIFHQDAIRNWENPDRQRDLHVRSDMHHHYSLGLFGHLMAGHTLQDIQALALICAHQRTFPKPEAAWVVTCMVFSKAIEMSMHMSVKSRSSTAPPRSILEIEMRKRVFWVIVTIHVTLSGKLARPMPIRQEDFDVEIPLAIDDELLHESGIDASREGHCEFLIGLEAFKAALVYMDLYNNMYAAKKTPQDYSTFIARAEKHISAWTEQWPTELRSPDNDIGHVSCTYLHLWALEFRLLLYHPSISLSQSLAFNQANLRICMGVSRDLLFHVEELQKFKCLDSTWHNTAVYFLAIQTLLYGHGQFKDELKSETLDNLRVDMGKWLSILGDIGGLLGSGSRLQIAMRNQINTGISQLEGYLMAKSTAPSTPIVKDNDFRSQGVKSERESVLRPQPQPHPSTTYTPYPEHGHPLGSFGRPASYLSPESNNQALNTTFSPIGTYPYPEPSGPMYSNLPGMIPAYHPSPYPAALAATALSHPPAYAHSVHPGSVTEIYGPASDSLHPQPNLGSSHAIADSNSWFQYTQTLPNGLRPQEYGPAGALLELNGQRSEPGVIHTGSDPEDGGGRTGAGGEPGTGVRNGDGSRGAVGGGNGNGNGNGPEGEGVDNSSMSGGAGQMWPMGFYGTGQPNA